MKLKEQREFYDNFDVRKSPDVFRQQSDNRKTKTRLTENLNIVIGRILVSSFSFIALVKRGYRPIAITWKSRTRVACPIAHISNFWDRNFTDSSERAASQRTNYEQRARKFLKKREKKGKTIQAYCTYLARKWWRGNLYTWRNLTLISLITRQFSTEIAMGPGHFMSPRGPVAGIDAVYYFFY